MFKNSYFRQKILHLLRLSEHQKSNSLYKQARPQSQSTWEAALLLIVTVVAALFTLVQGKHVIKMAIRKSSICEEF